MFSAALHVLQIKDLKDLSVFSSVGYYRHAGPKGPEEGFFTRVLAGDRPPRYGPRKVRLAMRRSGAGAPELRSPASNLANLANLVNPAHLLEIVIILLLSWLIVISLAPRAKI